VRILRAAALACLPALVLAGCGGGDSSSSDTTPAASTPTPTTRTQLTPPSVVKADAQPPVSIAPAARRTFVAGRTVVEKSGCLACHRIGNSGLSGIGPDLSAIGATLDRKALRRALLSPTAPMPSYRKLPKRDLDAVVSFLVRLLPDVNGGLRCVAGSDCG
jgi:cytochrome c5